MAAIKKKKAQSGAAISNKFTIPAKPKSFEGDKFTIPSKSNRKVTRSYTGVNQAEGDSMLNAFKKRNPGMKSGGKLKKK